MTTTTTTTSATVDLTPTWQEIVPALTWQEIVPALLPLLQSDNPEASAFAAAELRKMALLADRYTARLASR